MPSKPVKTGTQKGSNSGPLKKSSHDSDKPQKNKKGERAWVRPTASSGNSDKQKESSKGTIERVVDRLTVPVVTGPNGQMYCVNHKARRQGDRRREDMRRLLSSDSDGDYRTDSSDDGSERSAHQNGGERRSV